MKKFLIFIIFFVMSFFILPVKADIIPLSTRSVRYYGIGVLNVPKSYTIYQYPNKDSKIIREVNYDNLNKSAIVNTIDMRKVSYIAHVPENNIALLAVDLAPGNDWYCVFIDQQTGETGWINYENKDDFMSYRQLFYRYGKKYGIRMFNDLTREKKVLYADISTDSQILEELTYPTFISFTVIRGNWLLATVNDMTKQAKVGWFNWRNEDGSLNMFPNFKEQP